MTGRILKGVGSFYSVMTDDGVVTCRPRGLFRKQGITPLPGDIAGIRALPDGTGYLEEIFPRRNFFERPPVSNIDILVVLASQSIPHTDPFLVDRMAAAAIRKGVGVLLVINKCDISAGDELWDIYSRSGFPVIRASALTGQGVEDLRKAISGKVIAFTGNSGVGKSALLDRLDDTRTHATGEVSERLGRGRHTTRHVELFELSDGVLAADTPGFSSFDADEIIPKEELAACFPEFGPFLGGCRFTGCLHDGIKGCAVGRAVSEGEIHQVRYESYKRLLQMAKERVPWEKS